MVCKFTGKEPSPKGFGKCAHDQREGDRAKGTDGNMWVVAADKNGRLSWKKTASAASKAPGRRRSTSVTKKKASATTTTHHLTKAKNMKEAKANLQFLKSMKYDYDDPRSASKPSVLFVPQKGYKVRYAKRGATGKKGWVLGQMGISKSLGIIYEASWSGRIEKHKQKPDYVFESHGYLVTGSGSDPVFEVL